MQLMSHYKNDDDVGTQCKMLIKLYKLFCISSFSHRCLRCHQ